MRLTTAAAVIALAASILAAPTAGADSTDAGFINDLRQITDPSLRTLVDAAPSLLISTGRKVCSMLDQGYGFQAVEGMILDKLHLQGNSNTYYAGLFGVYAVADYCPAHQADSGFNGQY